MRGIKVDKDYKLQERYGLDRYEITLDSPGYNEPVNWYRASCKVSDTKKIAKLQAEGKRQRARRLMQEAAEWTEL